MMTGIDRNAPQASSVASSAEPNHVMAPGPSVLWTCSYGPVEPFQGEHELQMLGVHGLLIKEDDNEPYEEVAGILTSHRLLLQPPEGPCRALRLDEVLNVRSRGGWAQEPKVVVTTHKGDLSIRGA